LPIEFLSIRIDGGEIELGLQRTVGQTFEIEATVDFEIENWEIIATDIISNSPFTVVIPSTGQDVRFFRASSTP
jgi:hypothetical protein